MLQQYFITRAVFNSTGKLKRCIPPKYISPHLQDMAVRANVRGLSLLGFNGQNKPCSCSAIASIRKIMNPSLTYCTSRTQRSEDQDEFSESSGELSGDEMENDGESEAIPYATQGINSFTKRSHTCNELNLQHVGETVDLYGWIEAKRGQNFVILKDAYGSVQICFAGSGLDMDASVPVQSVIRVSGTVAKRTSNQINKAMATGEIEVIPSKVIVLSAVEKTLPFSLKGTAKPKESLALKHRYLYLRFPEMQQALRVRSAVLHKMRCYLVEDCNFVEVETPTLFGKTPGGAQEFVVPTRNKGKCYSLVQSPQQFKQMLMVGGIDRYFQVARCYRDEDSRSDRQPEFTQLDIEVSFADMDDIMNLAERILEQSWPVEECDLEPLTLPIPRMKYADALSDYGTDAPDLRYPAKIFNFTNTLTAYFKQKDQNNIRTLIFSGKASCYSEDLSKEIEKITQRIRLRDEELVVKVFPFENAVSLSESLKTVFSERLIAKFNDVFHAEPGDLVILAYGRKESVVDSLGTLRVPVSKLVGILPSCKIAPVWVTHFPLFQKGPRLGKFLPVHHPFTSLTKWGAKLFYSNPLEIEALSYDLVINGVEIGGGSERIRDPTVQKLILEKIGSDPALLDYFLNALGSGCPPHAGIALGIDRLMACILDRDSIRDVIAFPKTFDGVEPLTGAPKPPSEDDKHRYKLS